MQCFPLYAQNSGVNIWIRHSKIEGRHHMSGSTQIKRATLPTCVTCSTRILTAVSQLMRQHRRPFLSCIFFDSVVGADVELQHCSRPLVAIHKGLSAGTAWGRVLLLESSLEARDQSYQEAAAGSCNHHC